MKRVYLLACAIGLITLTSCEKGENIKLNATDSAGASLAGAWELRSVYGGYRLANSEPNYGPGNGHIWLFTDTSYQLYSKGQVLTSGKYIHTKDISPATGDVMDAIVIPENSNLKIHYGFLNDTLVFYQGTIAADGTIEKYVRVQPPAGTSN